MKFLDIVEEIKSLVSLYDDEYEYDRDMKSIWMVVDRGPRTDHGGGSDGDDWMDDDQLREVSEEYYERNKFKIKRIENFLSKNNLEGKVTWDYGEKGHFCIDIRLKISN